jgi:hypothetical protein
LDYRESMGKTNGDGRTSRVNQRVQPEVVQRETVADKKKSAAAGAMREAERLRDELAAERQRADNLESANDQVAERLDAAIESVKAILGKQG